MATDEFRALLEQRIRAADDEARAVVDQQIRARYERDGAVLISDMSGFSRITQERGIIHFVELIHRMRSLTVPLVEAHGGRLIKAEADNLFVLFDTAQAAVDTAVAMLDACREAFVGRDRNDTVAIGIGIASGRLLDLDGLDFFGDPVNLASKLGEDLASGGDLLVTAQAAAEIAVPDGWSSAARRERISNIEIEFVALTPAP